MSTVVAYSELLTNIRQITASLILPTLSDKDTTVELTSNCRAVTIKHQGITSVVHLPYQVIKDVSIIHPAVGNKELSLRFQIARDLELLSDEIPWPASSLTPETRIACLSCRSFLVDRSIGSWKDLPSENWAEMMDFWHCHKPDVENPRKTQSPGLKKGYSAFTRLSPSKGIGLVAVGYIELFQSNCVGLQVLIRLFLHIHHF